MKPMNGAKVAVLVANGFDEQNFLSAQKTLIDMGMTMRLISSNQGLVNGWEGTSWGHNYAVDEQLNTALGVDFEALVIPGGRRSIEKLKLTAHTKRFISSFMAAGKPVAVMGDAVTLMALTEQATGRTVAGTEDSKHACDSAGAFWSEDNVCLDENLLTGSCNSETTDEYLSTMRALFMQNDGMKEAA